ncbi:hypothetical protein DRE_03786 [Drechslerella stenobrocha 248]|uniref:Uncharacterized protein n=1 Tax=Drechslerella stenobrocha 248 TaxID=1043628 RepID=W7HU93_9PEZI|nr:hypothetical protein DRE_03786 [Drechslerella stenobrocha 248]
MSLLFAQDYALHQVRTRYLASMKDGIGERLININQNVFNVPGYKIAGWPRPSEIENYSRRAYSPPIPAGGSTDYFAGLPRSAALERSKPDDEDFEDDAKTIGRGRTAGSHGSLGTFHQRSDHTRSLSQAEDDDSSDLTDESDMEDETIRRTQHIRFPKMPVRQRAGSSPTHYANHANPRLLITSPGKSTTSRTRSGSHGMMEYERSKGLTAKGDDFNLLSHRIDEDTQAFKQLAQQLRASPATSFRNENELDFDSDEDLDDDEEDDASTISSDFAGTGAANANLLSPSSNTPPPIAPLFTQATKNPTPLAPLPPPRPISQIQPVSLLTQLIKANQQEMQHPLDVYTKFSGKGDMKATGPVLRRFGQSTDTSAPLRLRVYCPFCTERLKYIEVIVKRSIISDGIKQETIVSDTLGYILYRYREEDRQPPLTEEQCNVNKWSLHIMDEPGEPDEDFPPLDRSRAISAYQLEDLVLVEASKSQFEENERLFPSAKIIQEPKQPAPPPEPTSNPQPVAKNEQPSAAKPADAPIIISQSGTRTGASTHLKIFCNTPDVHDQSVVIRITSDTYIGEVLDIICKKKHLDSARHILRILGTSIIVPLDRLVKDLEGREELELVIRGPFDPILDRNGSPNMSNQQPSSLFGRHASRRNTLLSQSITAHDVLSSAGYQKFTVWRKMPMSFISRHERVLAIDGEYVHIMPSDQNKTLFDSPKTTSIHISSIIGCKQSRKAPLNFKIIAMKSREWKRYAFEATSQGQAREIVEALKAQISAYKMDKEQ